jgi:hypothetical protein
MSNYKFTPEHLYENTNKGLDIILKYCPDAKDCIDNNKHFKFRDEKTASATVELKENCYVVMDYGNKGYNPIEVCRYFTGFSFIEALRYLYELYSLGDTKKIFKSNTKVSVTDKEKGFFEVIEQTDYTNLDVIGRFITDKICLEYDLIQVKEYSFTYTDKVTKETKLLTTTSTENFPIFAYKFCDDWAKIYQPFDLKYKHSYLGKKPQRHVFGLTRLRAIYKETIDNFNSDIAKAKKNKKDSSYIDELIEKRDKFKIDSVIICSGGSDGLNVASLGYNAIWFNSEGEQLNYKEWKELNQICHNVYNLPDIDSAGIKYAHTLAETFWSLQTIYLPESIKKHNGKDFRDWLKRYSKQDIKIIQYHFNNLVSGALRMKFFDRKKSKFGNVTYKLRFEFLCYFLNIKGFYTYKIEQKNLDNIAPEIIIYIKIEGNIVKKVSPRLIRNFTKQFLREKGQPVEILEVVSMSTMFNDSNLVGLRQIELDFTNYTSESQYFFFENNITEVSANEIKFIPHGNFKNYVWEQSVKKHKVLPENPFFNITINAQKKPVIEILRNDCEYFNYLCNTSRIFWRKELEEQFGENLTAKEKYHNQNRFNIAGATLSDEEKNIQNQHLCNKMFALGYLMHRDKIDSYAKLIFVNDDKLKELDDEENGGSGKSIMFKGLNVLLSNRHWLDGKNKAFHNDKHILQGLTKENDYIMIEDLHSNFDIQPIYTWVTENITVNPKNAAPYEIQFNESGKIVVTTNYSLRNSSGASTRRVFYVTTSDYYHAKIEAYNEERKVSHDFEGKDLFKNWTSEQYNKHYNFLLQCCQLYLNNRDNDFEAPENNIKKNNVRASLGDAFISWADSYFSEDFIDEDNVLIDGTLNKNISRPSMYKDYCKSVGKYPKSAQKFKKALKDYCQDDERNWILNPKDKLNKDGYIKARGNKDLGEPSQVECFYIRTPVIENNEPETDLPF